MKKIILITGGERSGKSSYAERLAHELSTSPVYMATAKIWDEEFRRRVERHQQNRGPEWTNIEEEKELSRHDITGRVAVIDCVTLWLVYELLCGTAGSVTCFRSLEAGIRPFYRSGCDLYFRHERDRYGRRFPQ